MGFKLPIKQDDTSVIPKGDFCYTYVNRKQVNCPYWGLNPEKHIQENGYCTYLQMVDWSDDKGFPLLWDQIKECGINLDEED